SSPSARAATLLKKSIPAMKSFTVQERVIRRPSGSSDQPSRFRTVAAACSGETGGIPPSQGTHFFCVSSSCVGAFMEVGPRVGVLCEPRLPEAFKLAGEASLGDVGDVRRDGGADLLAELGIVADELGPELFDQAQHVVHDQDLAVAARAGPDPD